ncbi:MAG: hypothetical protein IAE97_07455 [Chthoniobacterales bacterium]|nr:hypothetical protein [Chthoniobacterales bacterium]
MKSALKILLAGIIGVVVMGASLLANPMKMDPSEIEQMLLREKPLGTQKAEIERWLIHEKKLAPVSSNVGFLRQAPAKPRGRCEVDKSEARRLLEFSIPEHVCRGLLGIQ